MYIHRDIPTTHPKMTKDRSKCHALQFILNLFQMFYEIIYCVFTFVVGSNSNQTQKITSYC